MYFLSFFFFITFLHFARNWIWRDFRFIVLSSHISHWIHCLAIILIHLSTQRMFEKQRPRGKKVKPHINTLTLFPVWISVQQIWYRKKWNSQYLVWGKKLSFKLLICSLLKIMENESKKFKKIENVEMS